MLSIDENHLAYLGWFAAGLAVALGLGWASCRRRPGIGPADALLRFAAPVSLFILAARTAMNLVNLSPMNWSSGRLSPAVGLLHGYSIYQPADSGPIFNTIYGPMAYLVYLPAGLFGTPTGALVAGSFLSHALILGPVLALCLAGWGEPGRGRGRLMGPTLFLCFWACTFQNPLASVMAVHADAPALGFGLLAGGMLAVGGRRTTPSRRALLGSAICATLAVWSKQTVATLLVLLPLWVLLAHGLATFVRYCGWLAASMVVATSAFVGAFGRQALTFNLLVLPKSHPWLAAIDVKKPLLVIGVEEVAACVPIGLAIGLVLYFSRGRRVVAEEGSPAPTGGFFARVGATLRANPWALFAGLGAGMVPLSMLSRIKVGGAINSYAPALYYLCASACVLLLDWHARNRERGLDRINDALKVALLISPFTPLLLLNGEFLTQIGTIGPISENIQEQAYRYALKHPGEAYFPWNPLSSLMAEGRAYHFEYGVFDRDLGGFRPDDAHLRAGLPEKLRMVAYPPNAGMEFVRFAHLPEYWRRVPIPELPGWICYTR